MTISDWRPDANPPNNTAPTAPPLSYGETNPVAPYTWTPPPIYGNEGGRMPELVPPPQLGGGSPPWPPTDQNSYAASYISGPYYAQPTTSHPPPPAPQNQYTGFYPQQPQQAPQQSVPPTYIGSAEPPYPPVDDRPTRTIPADTALLTLERAGFQRKGDIFSYRSTPLGAVILFIMGSIFLGIGVFVLLFVNCMRYCSAIFAGRFSLQELYLMVIWTWPVILCIVGGVLVLIGMFSRSTSITVDIPNRVVRVSRKGVFLPCLFRMQRSFSFDNIRNISAEINPYVRINKQPVGNIVFRFRDGQPQLTLATGTKYYKTRSLADGLSLVIVGQS